MDPLRPCSEIPTVVKSPDEKNSLILAIQASDFQTAEQLIIERKVDLNARDSAGHSALYYAYLAGHFRFVEFLLDSLPELEAEPLHCKAGTDTVLHQAAETRGHSLKRLLTFTLDLEILDHRGQTALQRAVILGMHENVASLLSKGAKPNAGDPPPLVEAYLRNDDISAELLLKHKADPNTQFSQSPLLELAEATSNTKFVELLTRYNAFKTEIFKEMQKFQAQIGASPRQKRMSDDELVIFIKQREYCKKLSRTSPITYLHQFVVDGRTNLALFKDIPQRHWLLKSDGNQTPFQYCCYHGSVLSIQQLCMYGGAEFQDRKKAEEAALIYTLQAGRVDATLELVRRGANALTLDAGANTLLHLLCHTKLTKQMPIDEFIKCLVEKGLKIDAKNSLKNSALHTAYDKSCPLVFQSLLANGANVNALDGAEKTVLVKAIEAGDVVNATKLLIWDGANRKDPRNLVAACTHSNVDIAQLLLDSSKPNAADPNATFGQTTPLSIVIKNIVQLNIVDTAQLRMRNEYVLFKLLIDSEAKLKKDKLPAILIKCLDEEKKRSIALNLQEISSAQSSQTSSPHSAASSAHSRTASSGGTPLPDLVAQLQLGD